MENRNLLLAFALSFAVLTSWTLLQPPPVQPPPQPLASGEPESAYESAEGGTQLPRGEAGLRERAPLPKPMDRTAPERPFYETVAEAGGELIALETPLYRVEVSTLGAALTEWKLTGFDTGPAGGRTPIVLTTGRGPGEMALATPFKELGLGDLSQALFTLEYEDPTTLTFRLDRDGITVRKTLVFEPDGYEFSMRVEVRNESAAPIAPRFLVSWPARVAEGQDFKEQALAVLHNGSVERQPVAALGSGGFLGSLTGSEPQRVFDYPPEVDWVGADNTYFLSAVLADSPAQASGRIEVIEAGKSGAAEIYYEPVHLPPGQEASREFRGYAGPKEQARLVARGGDTLRSIDLGWSWVSPLTRGFGWLLAALYSIIPNYGLAIIVLTVMVRLVTAPLTTKQMRSMERMRALAPKLKELKEKHGDDRQKQSEAMMRLYKQEGVNPLGGCLPMILQLPVFIGLFYALRSSIHLRHAPFFGWIDDLSAPETIFTIPGLEIPVRVLPLIMGATMVLQSKITPMQADPAQAKMMMTVMPIMMTVIFYQFPSGLVLYWMVSNVLAISHQLLIGRRMRANQPKPKTEAKGKAARSEA